MKKFISSFLVIAILSILLPAHNNRAVLKAQAANQPTLTLAMNHETMISNGVQISATAPISVLGKTYVDLYAVAPLLNMEVQWIPAEVGFFRVWWNGYSTDFTLISYWHDLENYKHKFFVKDSKIFVSLQELADFGEYKVTYDNEIINVGDVKYRVVAKGIDTYDSSEYIYSAYPADASYVVNPYQAYSYETMLNNAEQLRRMYPDLIKTSSIGKSVEGRDLLLIEFGKGPNKIFVCGTHHAREYIATTYLMYAIDRYAYAYKTKSMWGKFYPKEILDNITFCIVPMVNPDGVNLVQNGLYSSMYAEDIANMKIYEGEKYGYEAWKANVHGVDVNWNYNKDWSAERNKNPRGSTGFNGDIPYSEPETIAVSDYVDSHTFDAYISFHTQGQLIYWADNAEDPTYINLALKADTGFETYEEKATGIGGSFFDYVFRKFSKPTITVELCPYVGNYPYPNDDFNTVWAPAQNILLIAGNEILYKKSTK